MSSSVDLSAFKNEIFSQEDISQEIKRSAWGLFLHELGRTEEVVSPKKALKRVRKWMLIQQHRESIMLSSLSPTQTKVLYLLAVKGYTQAQAAVELNRSRETVKQYCINLRKQLGVDSFNQVIAIAVSRGWIPAPSPRIPKKV